MTVKTDRSPSDLQLRIAKAADSIPDEASWDLIWRALIDEKAIADAADDEAYEQGLDGEHADRAGPVSTNKDITGTVLSVREPPRGRAQQYALHTKRNEADTDETAPVAARGLAEKGRRLKVSAFIVLIGGFGLVGVLDTVGTEVTQLDKVWVKIIAVVLLYAAYRIHRSGRYYAQRARELTERDDRPPVIYLRSFVDDSTTTRVRTSGITEEEQIVGILRCVGPVIALDNPLVDIRAPGAQRISTADEVWRKRVVELIGRAQLVVIRLGNTSSLVWEIAQAREQLAPRRLLLIVPKKSTFDYDRFKGFAERRLGMTLTQTDFSEPTARILKRVLTLGRRFQDYYGMQGFIYFDDAWRGTSAMPEFTWWGYLHSPLTQPGRADMVRVLGPVFRRLSKPAPHLAFNWILLVGALVLIAGGVVGVLGHI